MTLSVLAGVFLAAFLSATLLAGISEIALLAAVRSPAANVPLLFFVATIGNVLGAVVNFYLGRCLLIFEDRRWFPIRKTARERAERIFHRYGQPVLLLSWLPIVGDPLTLAAGVLRTPLLPFLIFVTLGKAVRYAGLLWLMA